jgi:phage repressor protein C with HTH and peptisase S24 domain
MDKQWLEEQFTKTGRSQSDLARHLKVLPSVVNKMVRGRRQIKAVEAERIREFFNAPADNSIRYAIKDVRSADRTLTMSDIHSWANDVPVYGNALGGSSGGDIILLNGDTGLRVRRPPRLDGRVDILALYVQGDSMEPRYFSGELIYLEKARPPQIGDFVVVECKPGPDGEQPAYLKQLVGRSGSKLKLRQFNPDKILEFDANKVLQVIRVMSMQDLMG